MKKLVDAVALLMPVTGMTMAENNELLRALKEGTAHFDPEKLEAPTRQLAAKAGVEVTPELVMSRPGPGGGLDADPFHLTFFMTAAMLGKRRREVALATWHAWHLHVEGSELSGWGDDWKPTIKTCGLTGSPLFGEAFKLVLSNEDLARRVDEVRISDDHAEIHFDNGGISKFDEGHTPQRPHLTREARLDGFGVATIATLLKRVR